MSAATALGVALSTPASAAGAQKLQTFGTGVVSVQGDTVTIVNDASEYGGVYVSSRSLSGKSLDRVDLSFTSRGDVTGGAPRFSIPIDANEDGVTDLYAFVAADRCGAVSGQAAQVSTDNADCLVDLNDGSGRAYDNWDAFAADNPGYRVTPGGIPFIVADSAGTYVVSDISLR